MILCGNIHINTFYNRIEYYVNFLTLKMSFLIKLTFVFEIHQKEHNCVVCNGLYLTIF